MSGNLTPEEKKKQTGTKTGFLNLVATICYRTGMSFAICCKCMMRAMAHVTSPVGRFFVRNFERISLWLHKTFGGRLSNFSSKAARFKAGVSRAVNASATVGKKRGLFAGISAFWRYGVRAARHHRAAVKRAFNYTAPVAALLVLIVTLSCVGGLHFALAVEYDGETVGYVKDESVFADAYNMLKRRVFQDGTGEFEGIQPQYTLTIVSPQKLDNASSLCDSLITASCEEIAEGCGLYVDGEFVAAVSDAGIIRESLNNLLESRTSGQQEGEIAFANDVELREGLYPVAALCDQEQLNKNLSQTVPVETAYTVAEGDAAELVAERFGMSKEELLEKNPQAVEGLATGQVLNVVEQKPLLSIQVIKEETYTEPIPYMTKKETVSNQYDTYKKVVEKGQNGEKQITAKVTYLNGEEVEREVVNQTVLTEPVAEKIVVGTRKSTSSGKIVLKNGYYTWPVARVSGMAISAYYGDGRGHKGIDICAPKGTPIYAAETGVVSSINSSGSGYGLHFVVDHGNGLQTLYAHCSSIAIEVGQSVTRGQTIAYVGNTGNSTGNHLHFEARVNGVSYDPAPFLGINKN